MITALRWYFISFQICILVLQHCVILILKLAIWLRVQCIYALDIWRHVAIPTFHMFKGIPEGHAWDSFSPSVTDITTGSLTALLSGPFSRTLSAPSFASSFDNEPCDSSPSSELKSTSLSLIPGGTSPLHIFRSKQVPAPSSQRRHRSYPRWPVPTENITSLQERGAEIAKHIVRNNFYREKVNYR